MTEPPGPVDRKNGLDRIGSHWLVPLEGGTRFCGMGRKPSSASGAGGGFSFLFFAGVVYYHGKDGHALEIFEKRADTGPY